MNAVAVDANGDLAVAIGQSLAVDAGVVLVELIGAQAGIVGAHECRVGVAGTAQLRNQLPIDLALPAFTTVHRLRRVIARGIASVATGAGETFLSVNVLAELLSSDLEFALHAGVAIEAGVDGLAVGEGRSKHKKTG